MSSPLAVRLIDKLSEAEALHSRQDVLSRPCPVPAVPGLYVWYFTDLPNAPLREVLPAAPFRLAYIGIAPGRAGSLATLRSRIRQHLRGNASTSTLRLTLGCLLGSALGLRLEPRGPTRRLTWGPAGELALSSWLDLNARVAWIAGAEPWVVEPEIVQGMEPPLNLHHNRGHPFFYGALREFRREARRAVPGPSTGLEPAAE